MKKSSKTGITSIDLPYLKHFPNFDLNNDYDYEAAKKNMFDFIYDSAIGYSFNFRELPAFDFYGKKISNGEMFDNMNIAGNSFLNSGVKPDEVVQMYCLNLPETFYSEYGMNDRGIATEWFNPQAMTKEMLKEELTESKTKTMVMIDVMYPIVKEAIKGTGVEQVIVTSVQDSFNTKMKLAYGLQVFGLNYILQNPYFKHVIKEIEGNIPSERAASSLPVNEQRQLLKKYQQILLNIDAYAKKEKIMAKASFYKDDDKDERFILWQDFINEYGEISDKGKQTYEEGRIKQVIHTGGTTGPAKKVGMTDYAINSAVYQTTLMPFLGYQYEDSFMQVVPPIVAYSLQGMHLARYYQMNTHLIATYDRYECAKNILKTKANHYFLVPSFVETAIDDPRLRKSNTSFIKSVNHGGQGIDPEKDREADEVLNGKSRHGFGQNEEYGGIILNYDIPGVEKKYGCCGLPLFGNGYIIVDHETKEELPYGKDADGDYYIGDLYVTGPMCMEGYLGKSAIENENTVIYRDGKKYINTKDQAFIDEEGRLCFWTREERIIRTQKGKIFSNILEDIINKIPEVKECAVVASPHPVDVVEASCHIVLKPECWNEDVNAIIEKIIKIVEEETKSMYTYYTPGTYEFSHNDLPQTPFGKTAFRVLEKENAEEYEKNNKLALKKIRIK